MSGLSLLLVLVSSLCSYRGSSGESAGILALGGNYTSRGVSGEVSSSGLWRIGLEILEEEEEVIGGERAIRVSTSSSAANLSFPLLISVRQGRHISSWTLPFIEAGHAFPEVSKTLCPILNRPLHNNSTHHIIYIDISTPSLVNISFNFSAHIVTDYQLRINSPVHESVYVTSPVSYVFEYPDDVDRVLVKVTSSSKLCALVSVQEGLCPVDQLLDYPDHRGTFQTMQLLAAINMKRPVHQNFIYIVISIYHHDNCSGANIDLVDGLVTLNVSANYNPILISDERLQQLFKSVTIEIGHTLSYSRYVLACVILIVIFFLILTLIVAFFVFDEIFCYSHHASHQFLKKFKEEEGISDVIKALEEVDNGGEGRWRAKLLTAYTCTWKYLKKILAIIMGRQWLNDIKYHIDRADYHIEMPAKNKELTQRKRSETETHNGNEETDFFDDDNERSRRRRSYNLAITSLVEDDIEPTFLTPVERDHDTNTNQNQVSTESPSDDEDIDPTTKFLAAAERDPDTNTNQNQVTDTNIDVTTNTTIATTNTVDTTSSVTNRTANVRTANVSTSNSGTSNSGTVTGNTVISVSSFCLTDNPHINELSFADGKEFQYSYNGYWMYLVALVIFYSLPVYQLMLTYQKFLSVSGNEDFCYYNSLCSHPLFGLSAFNNVWSNVSFFVLGLIFIIFAMRRRSEYKLYEAINLYYEKKGKHEMKIGVPQYFGIYYAAGVALIGEAIMSAAYHICPTGNNYQFDTTMMFVLVTLGLYQLFKSRNPDVTPQPHQLLFILSLLILFIAFGVIYPGLPFYIVFFFLFEAGVVYTSLQLYYRWDAVSVIKKTLKKIKDIICTRKFDKFDFKKFFFPHDTIRFAYLVLSNLVNFMLSIVIVASQPRDFATSFLGLLIVNYLGSLLFLLLVKLPFHHWNNCGRKKALLKPVIYATLSVTFWFAGLYFYLQEVTNWLESPAGSRNNNKECIILGFYDTHDMWHISSAFGIFFSFLLMMTLEDHVEFKKRTEIRIY